MSAKKPVSGGMHVKAYPVLCRAIEEGFAYGWNRAHKHEDKPSKEVIEHHVIEGILSTICEVFDFDDDNP